MKICSICRQSKDEKEFTKDNHRKDGLCLNCRTCAHAIYEKNKERISAYDKEYYRTHKKQYSEKNKIYRQTHKEQIRARVNSQEFKDKRNKLDRARRKEDPKKSYERYRRRDLRKLYGMTLEDYQELLKSQNGVCAICGLTSTSFMTVDHDHGTGVVRGILCSNCNTALGLIKDNTETLNRMIAYLEGFRVPSPAK
jgi:hypothetical protein